MAGTNRGSMKSREELVSIIDPPPMEGEAVDFTPYNLERAVVSAVDRLREINLVKDSDGGTVELAKQYARRIDRALEIADRDPGNLRAAELATKALYLGPHLLNTLKALGGTPEEYQKLTGTQPKPAPVAASAPEEVDELADLLRGAASAR